MTTNFQKIIEFHTKFNAFIGKRYLTPSSEYYQSNLDHSRFVLRHSLLTEEKKEADEAKTLENLIKELGDILYVTYGFFVELGVDADKVFDTIHQSNLSKLDNDGKPILREDGKILKGPNYKPVDEITFLTDEYNI